MTRKLFGFVIAASLAAAAQNPAADIATARRFLDALNAAQWQAAEANFDARMKEAAPPGKLSAIWQSLGFEKQLGAPQAQPMPDGGLNVTVPAQFRAGPLDLLISFDSAGAIRGFFVRPPQAASAWQPPPYAQPARFHERPLTVTDGPWQLPGTLTLPDGPGPFPAVLLVGGSGPGDQDESVGAQKPFKDLAWGLASDGIAVLRYPKRTHVYGARSEIQTVKDEYLDDARAAIAALAAQPQVDARRVFLLGHSEGGYLAPRIAAADARVRGIVILAGETRPFGVMLVEQTQYLAHLQGGGPQAEAQAERIRALAEEIDAGPLDPKALYFHAPGSYWLDLRAYDPGATAARLKIPILVLQGGRDYQVREADFRGWKKALAGHANAQFRLYPGLTHLMAESTTPGSGLGTPADYARPGHVAPRVVSDIAAWIKSGRLP